MTWQVSPLGAYVITDQETSAWVPTTLWLHYSEESIVLPLLGLRLGFNTGETSDVFSKSVANFIWTLAALALAIVVLLARCLWRTAARAEAAGLGFIFGGVGTQHVGSEG